MAVAVIAAWIASTALPSVAVEDDEIFQVNTTVDGFDGVCDDAHCSLRDAIAAAAPRDTMLVSPGFYALTVTGSGGVGEGDIDLRSAVTIEGEGETGVFIDASALGQRAFTLGVADAGKRYVLEGLTIFGARDPAIDGASVKVVSGTGVLSGVTVSGSQGDDGGAVRSGPGTTLTATDSLFIGNSAAGTGGAIHSEGALSVDGITVTSNTATWHLEF